MTRTACLIFSLLLAHTSISQGWLDVGVKGGWGLSLLNNKNIWGDADYNHDLSTSGFFGGKLGLNFNMEHEITFDVGYGKFNQKFKHSLMDVNGTQLDFQSMISFTKMDYMIMYRHNENGKYMEIGPVLSSVSSPQKTDTYSHPDQIDFGSDHVNTPLMGATLGFGNYMMGTDNFGVTFGARISVWFSDLISENGKAYNFPTQTTYDSYAPSAPVTIQLVMEANFDFAYLAKAQCGRKKLLMF